jgi:hypothetical protein
LLMSESLSGFTGRARTRNVQAEWK